MPKNTQNLFTLCKNELLKQINPYVEIVNSKNNNNLYSKPKTNLVNLCNKITEENTRKKNLCKST